MEAERQVEKLGPQRTGDRRSPYCQFNPKTVGACMSAPQYVVTMPVNCKDGRSYMLHRYLCEEHLPRSKQSANERPADGLLTTQEAADALGISPMALHQWRHRDKGPGCTKVRNRYWYSADEVGRFVQARTDPLQAIADACGASPDELAAAVRKYAGGRLDV